MKGLKVLVVLLVLFVAFSYDTIAIGSSGHAGDELLATSDSVDEFYLGQSFQPFLSERKSVLTDRKALEGIVLFVPKPFLSSPESKRKYLYNLLTIKRGHVLNKILHI
ncbi:hypothetical protein [Bacillus suaedae]|uniref:Uncharacterized protein n=1 Tax=Halalkalibacter suaedae TaxID=2822140 RepID=A0A941APH8_9BACI|nr:hypothetical protein [Bacillus suaedae]MBP3950128.1 hypothetical protein [Bacillus suaedae]